MRFEHPCAEYLLNALPPVLFVSHTQTTFSDWTQSTVRWISLEAENPELGGETVITRLADNLVIQAESLGYGSEAAFRRAFKKVLGFNIGEAKAQSAAAGKILG